MAHELSKLSKKKLPIEPTVRIGKRGVTDAQIMEIIKHLDKRGTVKVKVLKTALLGDNMESITQKVSSATEARIIQIVGYTFTLYKPKRMKMKK